MNRRPRQPQASASRRIPVIRATLGLVVVAALLAGWGFSQTLSPIRKLQGWRIFDMFEPTDDPKAGTNQLKMMLTGSEAVPLPKSLFNVSNMWLGSFDRDGVTNLLATAPQSFVDMNERVVSSPGMLHIETARGQLSIDGLGFNCRLTNIVLLISNQVETLIRRELVRASGAGDRLGAPVPEDASLTNEPIRVLADQFLYHQDSNIVVYSGNVRVSDPSLGMTCQQLVLTLNTNGGVEEIVAQRDVILTGGTNQSRAYGDRAIYRITDSAETIELIGAPAHWEDGLRQGFGNRFVYDPRQGILTAPEKSVVRLPRGQLVQPNLGWSAEASTNEVASAPAPATNEVVEITAQFMTFSMPSTNRAGRTMVASNEVVILSPADQSRATGRRASFASDTGLLVLDGDASWESKGRVMQGETFQFDRSNQVFRVLTNARVRLPLAALGSNPALTGLFAGATNAASSQFIEITSRHLTYVSNRLDFQENVLGELRQMETVLGTLRSGWLTLHLLSNKVERVVATDEVRMRQLPALNASSNLVEKQLESEQFTVHVTTNGFIHQMVAETNVLVRQLEYASGDLPPVTTDLRADTVTAWFLEATNEVDRIVAQDNVVIEQVSGRATGNQAVYSRAEDTLVLSGEVVLESPNGLLNAPAAVLRHFGLWPGKLGRIGVPLGSGNRPPPGSGSSPSP